MKKKIYTFIVFSFMFVCAYSQSIDTIYLWPDKIPDQTASKRPAIQTDNTKGNVTRLTDITNPLMVAFKPDLSRDNKTSIVICPGGGYSILAIDKEGYEVAEWLSSLGYTAYVLQYRVPQNKAGALQDLQRAIRLVRHNAFKSQEKLSKIGVMGFSAGGHLCANASTNYEHLTYQKIDQADQLPSRPDFSLLIYAAYLDQGEQRSISSELSINKEVPPMFVFATSDDKHANGSLVLATALRDNNVPVELHLLPQGGHGYGIRSGNMAAETWPKLAEKWLQTILEN